MLTPPRNAPRRSRHAVLAAIGLAGALAVSACGSGSDDDADTGTSDEATPDVESSTDDEVTDADIEPDTEAPADGGGGSGSITLTMEDGTVYEISDVTSCDTSTTDPSGFPLTNGYDLTGRTADGAFGFSASRAGFDDENTVFAGLFEGDFDDEGKNALMLYSISGDGSDLVADGVDVSGTVTARAIGPTRPHGDSPTITVDASC